MNSQFKNIPDLPISKYVCIGISPYYLSKYTLQTTIGSINQIDVIAYKKDVFTSIEKYKETKDYVITSAIGRSLVIYYADDQPALEYILKNYEEPNLELLYTWEKALLKKPSSSWANSLNNLALLKKDTEPKENTELLTLLIDYFKINRVEKKVKPPIIEEVSESIIKECVASCLPMDFSGLANAKKSERDTLFTKLNAEEKLFYILLEVYYLAISKVILPAIYNKEKVTSAYSAFTLSLMKICLYKSEIISNYCQHNYHYLLENYNEKYLNEFFKKYKQLLK